MSRPMCEDAPCCGCCGQDRFSDSVWDDALAYERLREEAYDDDGEEEQDDDHHCDEEGDEDRYLDSYWEDRFGDCDY